MSTNLPAGPGLKTCPACGQLYGGAFAKCPHCGGTGRPGTFQKRQSGKGLLVLGIILAVAIYLIANAVSGGGGNTISGTFVSWAPVDAGHGYATVTFHNAGSDTATATCTVEVSTDFGDLGWDYVDITLSPGESRTGRVGLTVQNDGALRVTDGVVKDC